MRRSLYVCLLLAQIALPGGVQAAIPGSIDAQRLAMLDALTHPHDEPPALLSVTQAPQDMGLGGRQNMGMASSRQQQHELKALQTSLQQVKKENAWQAEQLHRLRYVQVKNSALSAEVSRLQRALKQHERQAVQAQSPCAIKTATRERDMTTRR